MKLCWLSLVASFFVLAGANAHEYPDDTRKALERVLKRELSLESEAVKNGLRLKYLVTHSKPGDVIELEPGRYTLKVPAIHNVDRFFHYEGDIIDLKVNHDLTIKGKSSNPEDTIIDWEGSPLAEKLAKGMILTREAKHKTEFPDSIALTVENLTFENAVGWGNNGAALRPQGTALTVRNCRFINNQNGILYTSAIETNPISPSHYEGELIVEDSYFERNGEGISELAHGIYMSMGRSITVRNTKFINTKNTGHHIKSLVPQTIVTGSTFTNKDEEITYNIDTPNGGDVLIEGNTFDYFDASDGDDNRSMFLYASAQTQFDKVPAKLGSYVFRNNVINNYHPAGNFIVTIDGSERNLKICGNTIKHFAGGALRAQGLDLSKTCYTLR